MGWKYEVIAWVCNDGNCFDSIEYRGPSLLAAIVAAWRAKRKSKCIKFVWRG